MTQKNKLSKTIFINEKEITILDENVKSLNANFANLQVFNRSFLEKPR